MSFRCEAGEAEQGDLSMLQLRLCGVKRKNVNRSSDSSYETPQLPSCRQPKVACESECPPWVVLLPPWLVSELT